MYLTANVNGPAALPAARAKTTAFRAKRRSSYGKPVPASLPRRRTGPHGGRPPDAGKRGHLSGAFRYFPAAGRRQPHPHFLAVVPLRGVRGEHRRHDGYVQPCRLPPPPHPPGQRPADHPPRRQGGLLQGRRHGTDQTLARRSITTPPIPPRPGCCTSLSSRSWTWPVPNGAPRQSRSG